MGTDFKEPINLHWALSKEAGEWLVIPLSLLVKEMNFENMLNVQYEATITLIFISMPFLKPYLYIIYYFSVEHLAKTKSFSGTTCKGATPRFSFSQWGH